MSPDAHIHTDILLKLTKIVRTGLLFFTSWIFKNKMDMFLSF